MAKWNLFHERRLVKAASPRACGMVKQVPICRQLRRSKPASSARTGANRWVFFHHSEAVLKKHPFY
jgi:hypothetical protein